MKNSNINSHALTPAPTPIVKSSRRWSCNCVIDKFKQRKGRGGANWSQKCCCCCWCEEEGVFTFVLKQCSRHHTHTLTRSQTHRHAQALTHSHAHIPARTALTPRSLFLICSSFIAIAVVVAAAATAATAAASATAAATAAEVIAAITIALNPTFTTLKRQSHVTALHLPLPYPAALPTPLS